MRHLPDDVGDLINKIPVVRDHDDRLPVLAQVVLEPLDGGEVEMVGRLVEHEDVRLCEQQPDQRNLDLFSPGKCTQLLLFVFFRKPEAREHFVVALFLREALLGPAEVLRLSRKNRRPHGLLHSQLRVGDRRLMKHADRKCARPEQARSRVLLIRIELAGPGDHLEQRRLAGPIPADDGRVLRSFYIK